MLHDILTHSFFLSFYLSFFLKVWSMEDKNRFGLTDSRYTWCFTVARPTGGGEWRAGWARLPPQPRPGLALQRAGLREGTRVHLPGAVAAARRALRLPLRRLPGHARLSARLVRLFLSARQQQRPVALGSESTWARCHCDFRFVVPCVQLSNTFLPCVRSLWMCALNVFIAPCCASVALCCSQFAVSLTSRDWQPTRDKEAVWARHKNIFGGRVVVFMFQFLFHFSSTCKIARTRLFLWLFFSLYIWLVIFY